MPCASGRIYDGTTAEETSPHGAQSLIRVSRSGHDAAEPMRLTFMFSLLSGAALALTGLALASACGPNGEGTSCFAPEHGPSDPSCADFTVGLTCPVDLQPWYSCTCTAADGGQSWVCAPANAGSGGASGMGGGGGGAGMGGSGTDAGSD
jgi:hypothetical protein